MIGALGARAILGALNRGELVLVAMPTPQRNGDARLDGVEHFAWSAEEATDALTISFTGELDVAVVADCTRALQEPLEGPLRTIVLDLGDVAFADSTALHMLLTTKRSAEAAGKRLLVGRISLPMLRLFEAAGVTSWFDYVEGMEPERIRCPLCEADILVGSRRCSRCNAAI